MEEKKDWIFTFGCGQLHQGNFVRVKGTEQSTRREMFRRYGAKWAFQYPSEEAAGVSRWGLIEIDRSRED